MALQYTNAYTAPANNFSAISANAQVPVLGASLLAGYLQSLAVDRDLEITEQQKVDNAVERGFTQARIRTTELANQAAGIKIAEAERKQQLRSALNGYVQQTARAAIIDLQSQRQTNPDAVLTEGNFRKRLNDVLVANAENDPFAQELLISELNNFSDLQNDNTNAFIRGQTANARLAPNVFDSGAFRTEGGTVNPDGTPVSNLEAIQAQRDAERAARDAAAQPDSNLDIGTDGTQPATSTEGGTGFIQNLNSPTLANVDSNINVTRGQQRVLSDILGGRDAFRTPGINPLAEPQLGVLGQIAGAPQLRQPRNDQDLYDLIFRLNGTTGPGQGFSVV